MRRTRTLRAGILLAVPCALALNPTLDVTQYAHSSWKIRDGFVQGSITAVAQTRDGYLWLGTDFGLVRFDGVKVSPWEPPAGQSLPSSSIRRLLAARDGTLWIGTLKGIASWRDGKLTHYPKLNDFVPWPMIEDREGVIWAGGVASSGKTLCSIQGGNSQCYEESAGLGGVGGLQEDRKGNLWVGTTTGVWRWRPGPPKFYPASGQQNGIQGMAQDDDGALLMTMVGGLSRLVNGRPEVVQPFPPAAQHYQAPRIIRDRDGGLWVGTLGGGIVHVYGDRSDVFTHSEGLSGDSVSAFFEDREGSIWVATTAGLDRFREYAAATYSVNQGLSNDMITSVLAASDGSIWMGTFSGLNRLDRGHVSIYRDHTASTARGAREIVGAGLPDLGVHSLFEDRRGRMLVSTRLGAGYLQNDRLMAIIRWVEADNVHWILEDKRGDLWAGVNRAGMFHVTPDHEPQSIPWESLGHDGNAMAAVADPSRDGIWLGFNLGGVAYFADGAIRTQYGAADGLGLGTVRRLEFDRGGALWAATEGGLSRLKDSHFATLTSRDGLPCDTVHWFIEDDWHAFWLLMPCGLVRIAGSEMDAWIASKNRIQATVFDSSDGVRVSADIGTYSPHVTKTPDGRIWIATIDGVSVVDPRHLPVNRLAPPVEIEQMIADHDDVTGRTRLPPRVRDLEIRYTALSLAAPEKVKFRYKLEGHDEDWQDAGTRRQAFYNDLRPRQYRFRLIASNNSGVWNEAGASFEFSVAPAYYQATWFRASCVAAILLMLAGAYQFRLRYLKHEFGVRLEARVGERNRIARDFHDTLLQSFQGVLLKFSAVTAMIPERPEVQAKLESILGQARQAITEGRNAVQGLRSSTVVANDLAQAIDALVEEFVASPNCPEFSVRVEGTTRDLTPLVRDDVHRIACEAVRNAFRHAQASRIEVEIHYERRQFCLRVVDNGKGIGELIQGESGRSGHFGLPGMQERAKLVGGKLAVLSRRGSGTQVDLSIPASLAYTKGA